MLISNTVSNHINYLDKQNDTSELLEIISNYPPGFQIYPDSKFETDIRIFQISVSALVAMERELTRSMNHLKCTVCIDVQHFENPNLYSTIPVIMNIY